MKLSVKAFSIGFPGLIKWNNHPGPGHGFSMPLSPQRQSFFTINPLGSFMINCQASLFSMMCSRGFVTDGGWVNSQEAACLTDLASIGKANFGFNCKYQQGGDIPSGDIQFNFKIGGLSVT